MNSTVKYNLNRIVNHSHIYDMYVVVVVTNTTFRLSTLIVVVDLSSYTPCSNRSSPSSLLSQKVYTVWVF